MARNFNPGHVTSPHLLQRVSQKVLLRFLTKYEKFLTKEKVMPASPAAIDYDGLSACLASPSEEMPPELLADLVYWDEVSQMAVADDLHDEAEKCGVKYGAKATREEITLLIRMKAPEAVEDLHALYHARNQAGRKKRFYSYAAKKKLPAKWPRPTPAMLSKFAKDMDMWYDGHQKGKGARVLPIHKLDSIWLIVSHGGTFKRENALDNGEPTMVFYRPEDYDILIYHYTRGELEIYNSSRGKRERRAYCTYLGDALFEDPEFFNRDDVPRYSLEPLRAMGAASMDCGDVDGVSSARLTDLQYRYGGANNHRVTHKANDVFSGLQQVGQGIPDDAELLSMNVRLVLDGELGVERNVKLYYPNVSVYDHESDADVARQFLGEQGFIETSEETEASD